MKKIAIIHYLPLEYYPPVTNLLNCIAKNNKIKVEVFSTDNNKERKPYTNENLQSIYRVSASNGTENVIVRLFKYLLFNVWVFLKLCWLQPDSILYYESYSVGPVYWYLKIFDGKTSLYIHYHEYASTTWYAKGMQLLKWYHKQEQNFLYKKAKSITQTNQDRIDLFLNDNPMIPKKRVCVLPNFPPINWFNSEKKKLLANTEIIKTVYVGSLSLRDTFIKEYCEWVSAQQGKVIFHIYAYNLNQDTLDYLQQLNSEWIRFYENGIEYNKIPSLLKKYDVGLILYRAHTYNYKFNAPNKLFEYIACELEIWYSDKMLGIKDYEKQTKPRIIPVNFDNIFTECLLNFKKIKKVPHQKYFAEAVYEPFIETLIL